MSEQIKPDEYHKIGNTTPDEHLAEIRHFTEDGKVVRLSGFVSDHEDENESYSTMATIYMFDKETGDTTSEHGRVIGNVRETSQYIWEHRNGAVTIATVVVSVALGSLWVRHRKSK